MSWLNANEYAVMVATVRDRVEDLQATVDTVVSRTDADEEPPAATRTFRQCPFRTRELAPCLPS